MLRIVDNDERPAMGYLFAAFHAARDEIVKRFQRKKELAKPFLEYIDARWDKHFDKNLHAASFWFNPNNQYNIELREKYKFTTSGVLDVIERYIGKDVALRSALTKEMKIFRNGEGDFGRSTAINDRSVMLAGNFTTTSRLLFFTFPVYFSITNFYFVTQMSGGKLMVAAHQIYRSLPCVC